MAAAVFALAVFFLASAYVVRTFAWRELVDLLAGADLAWFLGGGSASVLVYWHLRAWRWRLLLRRLDQDVPYRELYLVTAGALGVAIVTPFQSGEAIKVELLRRRGLTRFSGYSSFVVERVFDLGAVLALAAFSLLAGPQLDLDTATLLPLLGAGALLGVGAAVAALRVPLPGRLGAIQAELRACVSDPRTFALVALLSLLAWLTTAAGWAACLRSLDVVLEAVGVVLLTSVGTLINILSLVPGAVGVSEAGAAWILMQLGQPELPAQGGALMLRAYALLILAWAGVHLVLWRLAPGDPNP